MAGVNIKKVDSYLGKLVGFLEERATVDYLFKPAIAMWDKAKEIGLMDSERTPKDFFGEGSDPEEVIKAIVNRSPKYKEILKEAKIEFKNANMLLFNLSVGEEKQKGFLAKIVGAKDNCLYVDVAVFPNGINKEHPELSCDSGRGNTFLTMRFTLKNEDAVNFSEMLRNRRELTTDGLAYQLFLKLSVKYKGHDFGINEYFIEPLNRGSEGNVSWKILTNLR